MIVIIPGINLPMTINGCVTEDMWPILRNSGGPGHIHIPLCGATGSH